MSAINQIALLFSDIPSIIGKCQNIGVVSHKIDELNAIFSDPNVLMTKITEGMATKVFEIFGRFGTIMNQWNSQQY